MINYSSRLDWNTPKNKITKILDGKQKQQTPIIDLTVSNPTTAKFDYRNIQCLPHPCSPQIESYNPNPAGLDSAKNSVVDYYTHHRCQINNNQILLTSCTSEAYSHLFRLLANPGDNVLVPNPCYPLFDYLAQLDNIELRTYALNNDQGHWQLDLESLAASITPSTRAVIVVNPNNPTGSYINTQEREYLRQLCIRFHLPLIVDEVFFDYDIAIDLQNIHSFANEKDILTFVLSGLSKVSGLPQIKLGWICISGPEKPRSKAINRLELINDMYLTLGISAQLAAPRLLDFRHDIQQQIKKRIHQNLSYLRKQLTQVPGQIYEVEGGWYAIIQLPDYRSDEEWAMMILEKYNVLFHPGYFYNFREESHLVCSLIVYEEDFEKGIAALKQGIAGQ